MRKFLLLLWSVPALASTIVYSNFGPSAPAYSSLGEDLASQRNFTSGFQVTATGILNEIILPLFWRQASPPTGPLEVSLIQGTFGGFVTLETWTAPSSAMNAFALTEVHLASVLHPTLATGTDYFLRLAVPDQETGVYVWARNNQLDKQGISSVNQVTFPGLTSGAFQVTADTAAPEPATWLTLTSAAAVALFVRRRRLG